MAEFILETFMPYWLNIAGAVIALMIAIIVIKLISIFIPQEGS